MSTLGTAQLEKDLGWILNILVLLSRWVITAVKESPSIKLLSILWNQNGTECQYRILNTGMGLE